MAPSDVSPQESRLRWSTAGTAQGQRPTLADLRAFVLDVARDLDWQGWSLAQIGEHLGRSPEAVAGLLKRALKHLRQLLRERE
jgi:hypothetical protein